MTARLLLIDNYDSFTWNLAQAFMTLGAEVRVERNDQITVDEAVAWGPSHVCISPGPGRPDGAGLSLDAIARFLDEGTPLLGVCLGHQALCQHLGAPVVHAPRLMHGKSSMAYHDDAGLFEGLPNPLQVARYHSLIVESEALPSSLAVTAYTKEGEVMGVRHEGGRAWGVQFHPESVLTPEGDQLLARFLAVEAL